MTVYFVEYQVKDSQERAVERFNSVDLYFEWLQEYVNVNGGYPTALLFFKAECIFDAS